MKAITICNQKGGVGKTTTVHTIANGLANKGYKVLAVDADPQCNLTLAFGYYHREVEYSLRDLFENTVSVEECRISISDKIDLIPGSTRLCAADLDYFQTPLREFILEKSMLGTVMGNKTQELSINIDEEYDYVIFDTPPHIGIIMMNVLRITDYVIIPTTADMYSVQGLSQFVELLGDVGEMICKNTKIMGVLTTIFSKKTNLSKSMLEMIYSVGQSLDLYVFDSIIRDAVAAREVAVNQESLFVSNPKAKVAGDYMKLINEILDILKAEE